MRTSRNVVRAAVVQSAPVYMDLGATMEKTLALIQQAAAQGAQVVAFPETWLCGYPAWLDCCRDVGLWDHPPVKRLYARLMENAVAIPGPVTDTLGSAAREHGIVINISAHERVPQGRGRGTLYNTMMTFGPDGALLHTHRKITPTFTERLIWGQGDGASLHATETPFARIGGLICWEHWVPRARHVLHVSGEDIHAAAWPWVKEMALIASRHYAFEGRCFVLACGGLMHARDLPSELEPAAALPDNPNGLLLQGGSAIIGPDGAILAGPAPAEETILVTDLDLSRIAEESLTLDVTGHYDRPDIFDSRLPGEQRAVLNPDVTCGSTDDRSFS